MDTARTLLIVIAIVIVIAVGVALTRSTGNQEEAGPATAEPMQMEEEVQTGGAEMETPGTEEETQNTSDEMEETAQSGEITISMDESGFSPSEVRIEQGTTVTFVNNGQAKHWPASDVHPTHEILPEFDSNGGLATGGTYSHTFDQTGRWPMHDHLMPSNAGVIIVE